MVSLIASLGLSSMRVLALLMEFDDAAGYYEHGAVLPTIVYVGTVLSVILALVFALLLRRDLGGVREATDSYAHVFASALAGFIIIGCTLLAILSGEASGSALGIVTLVLSLPAALYFLIGKALPVGTKGFRIIASALLGLWLFSLIISAYVDTSVEISNPNHIMLTLALISATLYFLAEGRFRVGSPDPTRYVFLGFTAMIMLGLYSLPNMVLIILRAYPDVYALSREVLMLALFIYVLIRMCIVVGMVGGDDDEEEDDDGAEQAEQYPQPVYRRNTRT